MVVRNDVNDDNGAYGHEIDTFFVSEQSLRFMLALVQEQM